MHGRTVSLHANTIAQTGCSGWITRNWLTGKFVYFQEYSSHLTAPSKQIVGIHASCKYAEKVIFAWAGWIRGGVAEKDCVNAVQRPAGEGLEIEC
jgi:hypothetical protein